VPIYEFYCARCHAVYSFLARTPGTKKRPACPRCQAPELDRRVSAFAISRGRVDSPTAAGGLPDANETRLERAMESLAHEVESLDESDPRGAARLMRRLYDTAGLPLGSGMEEALRRMEAGEDPEAIEEEMGDILEEDPLSGDGEKEPRGPSPRRRLGPPRVDPELYDL